MQKVIKLFPHKKNKNRKVIKLYLEQNQKKKRDMRLIELKKVHRPKNFIPCKRPKSSKVKLSVNISLVSLCTRLSS